MSIRITTINTKGLNSPFKQSRLWQEALSQRTNILCVQETYFMHGKAPPCIHRSYPHTLHAHTKKGREYYTATVGEVLEDPLQ